MYLHQTDYKFKHVYDIKTLKDYCDYAARDIKRCEEVIKNIQAYQMALYEHVQEVINTPTKNIVALHRSTNYSTNKKHYNVQLEVRPQVEKNVIEGSRITAQYKDHKHFEGKDRHLAFKYADELSKKYNCTIERKGF
jgi:hypothetical protein